MNLKMILLSSCMLAALNAAAQSDSSKHDTKKDEQQLFYVERMPKAPYNLGEYLGANLHYPELAIKHNVEGQVKLKFVINEQGTVDTCEVLQSLGWGCDEEAIRVIKNMPPWTPGMQDGKLVKVYFKIPITFKLEDAKPAKKRR